MYRGGGGNRTEAEIESEFTRERERERETVDCKIKGAILVMGFILGTI
jgi:hypothetical protein